ncbi:hypothetical protein CELD12_30070 [Cellulomonas sp. NTE-D12]|nr:hypothetical protein CELD12_30070 [Cellulomonas sp. NTE-D12]
MTGVNQYIPGMPPGSRPLARALVAVLLVGAALAGCAPGRPDGPPSASPWGATTAPTVSPTTTPSATPTPTVLSTLGPLPDGVAPTRPDALDQPPTLEGAKAIATYFLLLYPYVYQTADLTEWNALSHPQCTFCSEASAEVRARVAAGQRVKGGNLDVRDIRGTEVTVGRFFEIQAVTHEARSQTVDSMGTVVDDYASGGNSVDMVVLFENGSWTVRGIDHKALSE